MKIILIIAFLSNMLLAMDIGVSKKSLGQYLKKVEMSSDVSKSEHMLAGITYQYGSEEDGVKKDFEKAIKHYRLAWESGIVLGGIELSVLLWQEDKLDKAKSAIYDVFSANIDKSPKELKLIYEIGAAIALDSNDYAFASLFLERLAIDFGNDMAAYNLFLIKYNGIGNATKDLVLAERMVNVACYHPKPSKIVYDFCHNSDLLIRN